MSGNLVSFLKRFPNALLLARYVKHTLLNISVKQKKAAGAYELEVEGVRLKYHPQMCPFPFGLLPPVPMFSFYLVELPGYIKKYSMKEGGIVIDGGAFIGSFAIFAAKKVGPRGRVFAFEPEPQNAEALRRNVEANGLANVKIVQAGLWKGEARLSFSSGGGASAISFSPSQQSGSTSTISTTSIDIFAKKHNLQRIDFVKMDIEGAEMEAIEGMAGAIRSWHPDLAIACYHERKGKTTGELLMPILKRLDYEVEIGNPSHPTLYATRSREEPLPFSGEEGRCAALQRNQKQRRRTEQS